MQQFIVSFGLVAIFVLMVAESAGIPIASEVTMLLGGHWPVAPWPAYTWTSRW